MDARAAGRRRLTAENISWLESLPFSLRVELPGAEPALVVHGSPRDNREGMGRMRSDEQVRAALAGVEEKTVIGAHIHYPYEREVDGTRVVVIGAVGCPFNRDINAQYGLFTWDGASWACEHRSVPYDHEPVYAAWRDNGYFDDGSLVSALMLLEYQTARTHYVPFWEWAMAHGLPLTFESYPAFARERGEPELIEVCSRDAGGWREPERGEGHLMTAEPVIAPLNPNHGDELLDALDTLLRDAVESGASVGFLPPLDAGRIARLLAGDAGRGGGGNATGAGRMAG